MITFQLSVVTRSLTLAQRSVLTVVPDLKPQKMAAVTLTAFMQLQSSSVLFKGANFRDPLPILTDLRGRIIGEGI